MDENRIDPLYDTPPVPPAGENLGPASFEQPQPPRGYSAPPQAFYAPPATATGGGYGGPPPAQPTPIAPYPEGKRRRRRAHPLSIALIAISLVLILLTGLLLVAIMGASSSVGGLLAPNWQDNTPTGNSFAVITVYGNILNYGSDALGVYDPPYHHSATVNYVKELAHNNDNRGILMYLDTPGGGVFESDELYLALKYYKEQTGRPIWAYMGSMCASGGYYVCAAADYLIANRNTTTGSIGVYIALTDTSEMYANEGIRTVLVRSGANKGVGMAGVPITEEQEAVYQSIVDESYEVFLELIAEGRGLPMSKVRELSDGRVYTGRQALQLDLVDELGDWETALDAFIHETGADPFYTNFSGQTWLGAILGSFFAELPKGDVEARMEMANGTPNGVPMVLYQP